MEKHWSAKNISSQSGRIAIVSGANSGLGYQTSLALASKGARVIMACRNLEKGELARQQILASGPEVEPELWQLDLASLDSVHKFADRYEAKFQKLDLLINNAGLMAIPYSKTREGFEMQFGVNHLGHFVLSARLWPILSLTQASRLVQLSSLAHTFGKIRFQDIHWEKKYSKWGAYGMSKLANLLFIKELTRRIGFSGSEVLATAAHPGYASTDLQAKGAKMKGSRTGAYLFNLANSLVAQSATQGALPTLFAATEEGIKQGGYYGPDGFLRLRGGPSPDQPSERLMDPEVAESLWDLSESLTATQFKV